MTKEIRLTPEGYDIEGWAKYVEFTEDGSGDMHFVEHLVDDDGNGNIVVFSREEVVAFAREVPEVKALVAAITGHEDRSLWWLSYVGTVVREYEKTHDWVDDMDPDATAEAIRIVERGVASIQAALAALEATDAE